MHHWWESTLVQPLWKTECRFLKKLKIELPYKPVIPLLGIYPKKMKTGIPKDICTFIFIVALRTIVMIMETMSVSTDGRMDKENMIYLIMECDIKCDVCVHICYI